METEMEMLKDFEEDGLWFNMNYSDLQSKYGEQFVAVQGKGVLASGVDFRKVLEQIKIRGYDPSSVIIEFIPKAGTLIIL